MKSRKILIAFVIVLFSGLGILYARSGGQQFKGTFNAPVESVSKALPEPLRIKTKYGKPDFAITRGKFIAMIAKAAMTRDEARTAKNLPSCGSETKNHKFEVFLNYACHKNWSGIKINGRLAVRNAITRKQAAEILGQAFEIQPENYQIYQDMRGTSRINPLGAMGIFEEINTGGNFQGEELLGEQTAKNWVRKLEIHKF